MRAILDPAFSEFLLRVGKGREPVNAHGEITLSSDMIIPYNEREESLDRFLTFPFKVLLLLSFYSIVHHVYILTRISYEQVDEICFPRSNNLFKRSLLYDQ